LFSFRAHGPVSGTPWVMGITKMRDRCEARRYSIISCLGIKILIFL